MCKETTIMVGPIVPIKTYAMWPIPGITKFYYYTPTGWRKANDTRVVVEGYFPFFLAAMLKFYKFCKLHHISCV